MRVKVISGLLDSDYNNFIEYDDIEKIEELSKSKNNCYLRTLTNEIHKIFLDIDYNIGDNEIYNDCKEIIDNNIESLFRQKNYSLAESHKINEKVSYRLVLNESKMSIQDMKIFVEKEIKSNFEIDCIDLKVYRNGKIRLPFSTKYYIDKKTKKVVKENRPLNIIKGQFKDFITIICDNAKLIEYETLPENINNDLEKEINNSDINQNDIIFMLDNINPIHFDDYLDWIKIGFILKRYNFDSEIFENYSKKSPKYIAGDPTKWYNKQRIDINRKNPTTLGTLKYWLKNDNLIKYNELKDKYVSLNLSLIMEQNESDYAKLFFKLNPTKYIFNPKQKNGKWYEYNKYNVLEVYETAPTSLINLITDCLQKYIINFRNQILPSHKDYDKYMTEIKKAYCSVGNSGKVKGIISYLQHLYSINNIENLLDSKKECIAFNDKLYDLNLGNFRNINPDDYITKTTGYNSPISSNVEIRNQIYKLLSDIFEIDIIENDIEADNYNQNILDGLKDYWLITTSLSLFGNKFENFYIHTGKGGNGKGLLSKILSKCLGSYFYTAEQTFMSSKFKQGVANPTLAQLKGIRYLLVVEPDSDNKNNGDETVKLNTEFIKMITGGDEIRARDLYSSNINYLPQFTPFLQCNNRPELEKIDGGIKRRLKIIKYCKQFVDSPNPDNKYELLKDISYKDKINIEFYQEFMMLLLETATKHKNDLTIKEPYIVRNETDQYIDNNDPIKDWLLLNYEHSNNSKNRLRTSVVYEKYISDIDNKKISNKKFLELMNNHSFENKTIKGVNYYINIVETSPLPETNLFDPL